MNRRLLIVVGIGVLGCAAAMADEIVVGGKAQQGNFEGFVNGTIQFINSKGKFMKEQPTRVTKLTVAAANKATYVTSDKKEPETGVFRGFEKLKFVFDKDGKEVTVHHTKMKKLDVEYESKGGEGADGSGGVALQEFDVAPLEQAEANGQLTPEQVKALKRYKTARAKYDEFLSTSVQLVKKMDGSQGAVREDLLNQLRARKNDEQLVKRDLLDAMSTFMAAFPEPGAENAPPEKAPVPVKPGAGKKK